MKLMVRPTVPEKYGFIRTAIKDDPDLVILIDA
jgi:hypothetical protein